MMLLWLGISGIWMLLGLVALCNNNVCAAQTNFIMTFGFALMAVFA